MQIPYYDNQIKQWIQYQEQKVVPYWNDPTYSEWARSEYHKCNESIRSLQQNKLHYQMLVQESGQYQNNYQHA